MLIRLEKRHKCSVDLYQDVKEAILLINRIERSRLWLPMARLCSLSGEARGHQERNVGETVAKYKGS